MTEKELRKYLDDYREEKRAVKILVDSYDCIIKRCMEYKHLPVVREEMQLVQSYKKRDLESLQAKTAIVVSWSELISNEIYKQIFQDRYIVCLPWSKIYDKYFYSESQIHNIMSKCRKEIIKKCQIDISADRNSLLSSAQ